MAATIVALRLLGLIAGAGLYGSLAALFLAKRGKRVRDWLGLIAVAGAAAWCFAGSLVLFRAIVSARGTVPETPGIALTWLALVPGAAFAWAVYRFHSFGLFIRRRLVVALGMSLVTAGYLLMVRNFARYAETEFEAYGRLAELALILAAGVLWLPLYNWLARRQARRMERHAAFGKRLLEESAGILDLTRRLEFMAERVQRAFGFRKALLTLDTRFADEELDFLFEPHAEFNYIFPLRYEDRVAGLLLVDSAPRSFLDEDEAALVSLCRQMAHSIEACRMVEEKIRLETALLRQEHLATIGTLAATIAHEVKNPLSAIKTLVQVMAESPEMDERFQRDLAFMRAEIDRLNACVEQLLTYSRPAPGRGAAIPLGELMHSAARMLAHDYAEKRVRVECRVAAEVESHPVDYQAVQQALLNLGLNAAQAVSPGGSVHLEAARAPDGRVAVSVTDDGPGIAPEARDKVFEPFYSTKAKGTGLGLAIVRKNVQHLGGEVRLTSPAAAGRGARFTVLLPVLLWCVVAAAQTPRYSPEQLGMLRQAVDEVFNMNHARAAEICKSYVGRWPDDPAGYAFLARTYWSEELTKQQLFTIDRFAASGFFSETSPHRVAVPAAVEARFRKASEEATARGKARLRVAPSDQAARYAIGVAYQNLASFEVAFKTNWWQAVRFGDQALRYHRELLAAQPAWADAHLTTGIYQYAVGSVPWKLRWLSFLLGYRGDKETGKRELQLAADRGVLASADAALILVLLHTLDKEYAAAYRQLAGLHARYPRNYLVHMNMAALATRMNRHAEALAIYRQILAEGRLDRATVYNQLGAAARAAGDLAGSARWLRQSLEQGGAARTQTVAHLELGKTLDVMGQRAQALEHYRAVLAAEDFAGSRAEAQRYVKSAYRA